jgi:hypothetical protein
MERKKSWGMLTVVVLLAALCVMPTSQALGATVTLDDFSVGQGSSQVPVPILTQCAVGNSGIAAATGASSVMYGGTRILRNTQDLNTGVACVKAYVDGNPNPALHAWAVANDPGSTGFGLVVWNGSTTNINAFTLPPLDLTKLLYVNMTYIKADHATTFNLSVYSDATHGSQAEVSLTAGEIKQNYHFLKAAFSPISGLTAANFGAITRVTLTFLGVEDVDTEVRKIEFVLEENPNVTCDYKTLNGAGNLVLPSTQTFPVVPPLTAEVKISNALAAGPDTVVIEDNMPVGMDYVGPTTIVSGPAGFVLGEPVKVGQKLTWTSTGTNTLAGGQSLVISFKLSLAALADNEVKTNEVQARGSSQATFTKTCPATVTKTGPSRVPAMNEWATIIAVLVLMVVGFSLTRRSRRNQA